MIAYPTGPHAVADLRRRDLLAQVQRERLAMTAREQTPGAAHRARVRLLLLNAVRMLPLILGRRLDLDMPRDAQRPAVP